MCFLRSKWQYTSNLIWVLWIRCNPLSTTTAREIDSWTRLVVNLSNIALYYRRLSVKQEIGAFSREVYHMTSSQLIEFPINNVIYVGTHETVTCDWMELRGTKACNCVKKPGTVTLYELYENNGTMLSWKYELRFYLVGWLPASIPPSFNSLNYAWKCSRKFLFLIDPLNKFESYNRE